jgi:hypothetical protein
MPLDGNKCSTFGGVEKVLYLLMGQPGAGGPGLVESLLGPTVSRLRALGARGIQINVTTPGMASPFAPPAGDGLPALVAAVWTWVDTSEGANLGEALPEAGDGAGWHGYLVCESEPLANTAHPPGPDGRVPGFAQLVPLMRPARLTWEEWRQAWQGGHTSVAIGTQSSFRYVQNVVVRPLVAGAPVLAAVVEECFPIEAASDMHVFFDAVGDDAKLARNMTAMSQSCDRFMDGLTAIAWTAEYLIPD